MTTLIARPPVDDNVQIKNLAFYQDVSTTAFRQAMRIDTGIDNDRVVYALRLAIIYVNARLETWRAEQELAGYTDITAIPSDYADSDKVSLYLDAVYQYAKYMLLNQYRDYDGSTAGHDKADRMEQRIGHSRDAADQAIAALTQKPLTRVVLL